MSNFDEVLEIALTLKDRFRTNGGALEDEEFELELAVPLREVDLKAEVAISKLSRDISGSFSEKEESFVGEKEENKNKAVITRKMIKFKSKRQMTDYIYSY